MHERHYPNHLLICRPPLMGAEVYETQVQEEAEIDLTVFHDNDVAASSAAAFGRSSGLTQVQIQMMATAIYELGNNILIHAGGGTMTIQTVEQAGCKGVRITASDRGPGIADIQRALVDGYTTRPRFSSLGLGLGGVSRLMDEMTIDSTPGKGTCIVATKWGLGTHEPR